MIARPRETGREASEALAARLSPGVRELITDLEAHMQAVALELDRSR
jgi:hypothetical protein